MVRIKVGDYVRSVRDVFVSGEVVDVRDVKHVLFDYRLCLVEHSEGQDWVNERYLEKV